MDGYGWFPKYKYARHGCSKGLDDTQGNLSDSVLWLVAADIMQGDPGEPNYDPTGYYEFVNDCKLYHTIITWYTFDPWFSNFHNLKKRKEKQDHV